MVKCVNEEWDVQAYVAIRKSGALNLWSWLHSLRGSKFTIGAWDDPLPLAIGFWRSLRSLFAYIWSAARTSVEGFRRP